MEDSVPRTDQHSVDAALSTVGVSVAEPQGDLVIRNGRMTIGVITVQDTRVRAIPRRGITHAERKKLVHAATMAWLHGPVGPHWVTTKHGLATKVFVRVPYSAASALMAAMSSVSGVPVS